MWLGGRGCAVPAFNKLENSGTKDLTVGRLPFISGPLSTLAASIETMAVPLHLQVDAATGLPIGDVNNDGLEDAVAQNLDRSNLLEVRPGSVGVFLLTRNKKA